MRLLLPLAVLGVAFLLGAAGPHLMPSTNAAPFAGDAAERSIEEGRVTLDEGAVTSGRTRMIQFEGARWYEVEHKDGGWYMVDVIGVGTPVLAVVDFRKGRGGHVVELEF